MCPTHDREAPGGFINTASAWGTWELQCSQSLFSFALCAQVNRREGWALNPLGPWSFFFTHWEKCFWYKQVYQNYIQHNLEGKGKKCPGILGKKTLIHLWTEVCFTNRLFCVIVNASPTPSDFTPSLLHALSLFAFHRTQRGVDPFNSWILAISVMAPTLIIRS